MHKYLKMALIGAVAYTAVASFYNSGKAAGLIPNPIGKLVGFA